MTWLMEIPVVVVRACLTMLPRLQAEESIRAANEMAVGAGGTKKDAHVRRSLMQAWSRAAESGARRRPRRQLAAHDLGAMGIGSHVLGKTS